MKYFRCLFDTIVALGTRRKELINATLPVKEQYVQHLLYYFICISLIYQKKINRKLRVGCFL